MLKASSLFPGNGMEEIPTKQQEDVTQTAEPKDLPPSYSEDENYGTYRKLNESEIEQSNNLNYTKYLEENGEAKTTHAEVQATYEENKTTNSELTTTNNHAKRNNEENKTHNAEFKEKMYNYVQNIKMSKSGADLSINDKNGNESGLLPESTTVARFSPIWKQVIAIYKNIVAYVNQTF